eukprot:gene6115-10122_t
MRKAPKLILHFDVNKTLIILDPAANKSVSDMINGILSQATYGKLLKQPFQKNIPKDFDEDIFKWQLVSTEPTTIKPDNFEKDNLMTYHYYLENYVYPHPKHDKSISKNEVNTINKALDRKNDAAKNRFTEKGFPGEKLRKFYDELLEKLTLKETKNDKKYVFILPTFFKMILDLIKDKIEFSLVIRTFGIDIDEIAEELNLFCEGKHPNYPNVKFNGENGTKDLRLHGTKTGNFYRNGDLEDHLYLVEGTIDQIEDMDHKKYSNVSAVESFYENHQNISVTSGYEKIYSKILSSNETRAFRDHYHWWNSNNRSPDSGKVFIVNPEDKDVLQIFFDDNIIMEGENNGIVNLRHVNGVSLDINEHLGVFVHHVEALCSITDENYFYNLIQKSLKAFNK